MIKNLESFKEKAKKVHNNIYCYDKSVYINTHTNLKIFCNEHGEFIQTPHNHLNGSCCPKCSILKKSKIQKKDLDVFIGELISIFKDSYTYDQIDYVNTKTKVLIKCEKHGNFTQYPYRLLYGIGCKKCTNTFMDNDYFIMKSIEKHGYKYNYDKVVYINSKTKVIINCPQHGDFYQLPTHHLSGSGCKSCSSSKGELQIINYLTENNINFKKEYSFENCINPETNRRLRFDFFIPNKNILIEYDGEQHFIESNFFNKNGYNLQKRNNLDEIKNNFSKSNNIELIRIKYNENIKNKLNKYDLD